MFHTPTHVLVFLQLHVDHTCTFFTLYIVQVHVYNTHKNYFCFRNVPASWHVALCVFYWVCWWASQLLSLSYLQSSLMYLKRRSDSISVLGSKYSTVRLILDFYCVMSLLMCVIITIISNWSTLLLSRHCCIVDVHAHVFYI